MLLGFFRDKDLISIKNELNYMKSKDIIIAIVALIVALLIIKLISNLFWWLTILAIAYIIYLFLKKAL